MTLTEELQKFRPIEVQDGLGYFDVRTPANTFHNWVFEPHTHRWIAQLTCRGEREDGIAREIVTIVKDLDESIEIDRPFAVITRAVGPFDQICLTNHAAHHMSQTFSKDLHERTLVLFPSYRCEFIGNESPEEIKLMRRDYVDTSDWSRAPSPKMRVKFEDRRSKTHTNGKFQKITLESALIQLEMLRGGSGFLEVDNFRAKKARLEPSKMGWSVDVDDVKSLVANDQIVTWLNAFVKH